MSASGLARAFAVLLAGVVLACSLYAGFIKAGVIRNPLAPAISGDLELPRSDRPGIRVLFVGNSQTYFNDLPRLVHELAEADGGPPVFTVGYTRGGFSLKQASRQSSLKRLLREVRWNVVVLQEHSWLAASPYHRPELSIPYARRVAADVRRAGARPVLFMTPGYESNYASSQADLETGYRSLGRELSAPVVQVGVAWRDALRLRPMIRLWHEDGAHPGHLGSYLAACVFHEFLTGRNPVGNSFTAGLLPADARFLQRVASAVS